MESMFSEMDIDGKGTVMFSEWCQYLQREERKFNTPLAVLLDAGNDQQKESKTDATAGDARGAGGVPKREGPKCTGSVSTFWGTYEPTRVFESMFTGLTGTDDEAKGLRKKAWRDADASGNGHASLAEVRTAARTRTR